MLRKLYKPPGGKFSAGGASRLLIQLLKAARLGEQIAQTADSLLLDPGDVRTGYIQLFCHLALCKRLLAKKPVAQNKDAFFPFSEVFFNIAIHLLRFHIKVNTLKNVVVVRHCVLDGQGEALAATFYWVGKIHIQSGFTLIAKMHKDFICYVTLCDAPNVVVLGDRLLYHLTCDMVTLPKNAMIAEWIRFYRRKAGLYTHELAQQAEISRHAVMDYESGTSEPPLELLNKIAEICGVEADKLYDGYYVFLAYPYSAKLKEIRKANKLLQRDLAAMLSVGTSAVADWEQGRTVIKRKTWEHLVELGLL